jgi:exo beta-1,2-glucooligosaccharide sophorohydrolase (non-reducing end)
MFRKLPLAFIVLTSALSAQNRPLFVPTDPGGITEYYRHSFFDNSQTSDTYYYSEAQGSAPSTLKELKAKLPVEREYFHTPPNALRVEWQSAPGGGWAATVNFVDFRNRAPGFTGDTLSFWVYSPSIISANDLPLFQVTDTGRQFSQQLRLGDFLATAPQGKWVEVRVPLAKLGSTSLYTFSPLRSASITFSQNSSDNEPHVLIVDDINIDSTSKVAAQLRAPQNVRATGYERHIDVTWDPVPSKGVARFVIYRAMDGQDFKPIGIQVPGLYRYTDFIGEEGKTVRYRITVVAKDEIESRPSPEASASTRRMTDDELLTMVQEATFRYYWEAADPSSGAALENIPGDSRVVATGATGFGVMAIVVGADRGFVSREDAAARLLKLVAFLEKAPRYHGAWSHFMNGSTGETLPVFGKFDNGGDLVETSFLLQGLLAARQYFRGETPTEKQLYEKITRLWETTEWDWYRRTPTSDALYWHWSPNWSWHMNHRLTGFNETMITYLLAIASPTHGVPAELYYEGWSGSRPEQIAYRRGWSGTTDGDHYANGNVYDGIKLDIGSGRGGPLFFAQYSYLGFDPRVRDKFTNYFENFRNMALINRAWCIRNPGKFDGYGANAWGLTASDGPDGYNAHEPNKQTDDGTLTPTGALASFPYTPAESMEALKHFYRDLGDRIWGIYGPLDAINQTRNWVSPIYMGLNQAPITVMIENYRTDLIWKLFSANPEIQKMQDAIGLKREVPSTAR